MTSDDILKVLKNEKEYLQAHFGVVSIGLFGSYVKGVPRVDSDVDLLVELTEPRFESLVGVQIYLEEKIGRPIELVRKRPGMSDRFLKRIEDQVQYA